MDKTYALSISEPHSPSADDGKVYTISNTAEANIKSFQVSATTINELLQNIYKEQDNVNIDFHIICKVNQKNSSGSDELTNLKCIRTETRNTIAPGTGRKSKKIKNSQKEEVFQNKEDSTFCFTKYMKDKLCSTIGNFISSVINPREPTLVEYENVPTRPEIREDINQKDCYERPLIVSSLTNEPLIVLIDRLMYVFYMLRGKNVPNILTELQNDDDA